MLVWSLVLSLAAVFQTARAYPKPSHQQYDSLGKHGGVATEVCPSFRNFSSPAFFLNLLVLAGGGMLEDRSRYACPGWERNRCCESTDYTTHVLLLKRIVSIS